MARDLAVTLWVASCGLPRGIGLPILTLDAEVRALNIVCKLLLLCHVRAQLVVVHALLKELGEEVDSQTSHQYAA